MIRLALLCLLAALIAPGAAAAASLTGTAAYRERIALPPNARFEAAIVDAGRADAPAAVFAETAIDAPGQPPIAFSIAYDPARVDPKARYRLRASIRVDGRLWFATDRAIPVLAPGGKTHFDLTLVRVAEPRAEAAPAAAPEGSRLRSGAFRYFADAAAFKDCRTGAEIPVLMEGGYRDLEAAYLRLRAGPAAPLIVTVEGRIEARTGMEGPPRPHLVVERFLAAWPGETCARNRADAPLLDTEWKIVVLDGEALTPIEHAREANLVLHSGPGRAASATVGCNRMAGAFETGPGGALKFGAFATTMMACPPPLDAREQALAKALAATRAYAIAGSALVLYDETRRPLAVLSAVASP